MHFLGFGAGATRVFVPEQKGQKEGTHHDQSAHHRWIRRQKRRDQVPGERHTRRQVSVATRKAWKDEQGEWKDRTQWHNVIAYGKGFEPIAERLVKGALVFVQGELTTREYDRTIKVTVSKKSIDHVIQQLVVELKADAIRVLDRSVNSQSDAAEPIHDEGVPF